MTVLRGLVHERFGVSELLSSLFMSINMVGAVLAAPLAGALADRRGRHSDLIVAALLADGLLTLAVPWTPLAALPPLMVGLGVASAVMFVPSLLITSDVAPVEIRTTAMGAFNAAGSPGFILGPMTAGLVSQAVAGSEGWEAGYRSAFAVAGASEIACVALGLPFLRRLMRRGRTT